MLHCLLFFVCYLLIDIVRFFFFCFKQKTAYEMRISDWSSDVCSSDLSYGVSSIEELLEALEPQTRSGRGRGGGRPVILVNGRRISGFGAVRNIPPEAIAKVEIFPEEVALQYGSSATERVVNFVLKPDFRQVSEEGEAGGPTQRREEGRGGKG